MKIRMMFNEAIKNYFNGKLSKNQEPEPKEEIRYIPEDKIEEFLKLIDSRKLNPNCIEHYNFWKSIHEMVPGIDVEAQIRIVVKNPMKPYLIIKGKVQS